MRAPAIAAWVGLVCVLGTAVAAGAGCGSDRDSTFDDVKAPDRGSAFDNLESIEVTPKQADLVGGDTNQSQAFTATGRFKDGSTRDLTADAVWRVSKDGIVTMNGATATATWTASPPSSWRPWLPAVPS